MNGLETEFITLSALEETVGRDSLITLLKMHRANVCETLEKLSMMNGDIDYSEVHMIAHRLRGACGSLGFIRLSDLLNQMDKSAKLSDDKTVREMVVRIIEENNLLKVAVHERYPEINQ